MATGTISKEDTKTEIDSIINSLNTGITEVSPAGVSVPTNTLKNIASISVKKGMNLIIGNASFASDASTMGLRQIGIAESTTSEGWANVGIRRVRAAYTDGTVISICCLYNASANKTLYLNVKHTHGTAITVTGRIQAYNLRA